MSDQEDARDKPDTDSDGESPQSDAPRVINATGGLVIKKPGGGG